MSTTAHLWGIGYDDMNRADEVRERIVELAWGTAAAAGRSLFLLDIAVVVRHLDGSFTLDRLPLSVAANILASSAVGFLAGLVVAAPTTGAAIGAVVGAVGTLVASRTGIDEQFIREVQDMLKPGSSALFVLDDEGNMEAILDAIRGLGGTVLRTNVDLERATLIQATLSFPTRQANGDPLASDPQPS